MPPADTPTNVSANPGAGKDRASDDTAAAPDKKIAAEPAPEPVKPIDSSGDEASDRAA